MIATKCFNPIGADVNARGSSRRHVAPRGRGEPEAPAAPTASRSSTCTSYDPHTPLEETLRALEDLVRAGKVLYPALSNYAAWQTQAALGYQERNGWARLQAVQPMYSLVKRQAEVEILPMAQANGIGVVPYSPAGGGLLSGKYAEQGRPAASPTTRCTRRATANRGCTRRRRSFAAFCKQRGCTRSARRSPGSARIPPSPRRSSARATPSSCRPRSTR